MSQQAIYSTSTEAEAAFYQALREGNFERMMSVWAQNEEIVCIHPGGPRIHGQTAVRETWRQMLSAGNRLQVELVEAAIVGNATLAIHNLSGQISTEDGQRRSPPILATNVYVRDDQGWRMILHHASAAPDEDDFGDLAPHTVH